MYYLYWPDTDHVRMPRHICTTPIIAMECVARGAFAYGQEEAQKLASEYRLVPTVISYDELEMLALEYRARKVLR